MSHNKPPQSYRVNHDLLTLREAAGYADYSTSYIAELTRVGKLPFVKRGRRKYINRDDLDRLFVNEHSGTPACGIAEQPNHNERLDAIAEVVTSATSPITPGCKTRLHGPLS